MIKLKAVRFSSNYIFTYSKNNNIVISHYTIAYYYNIYLFYVFTFIIIYIYYYYR